MFPSEADQTANAVLMRYAELMANRPETSDRVLIQEALL